MTVTLRLFALLLGFFLDLLLGDPSWLPHPIRAIGALIAALEKALRRLFPKRQGGELAGGAALVILVLALSGGFTLLVLWLCGQVGLWLRFLAETVLCYQLLATRSLKGESMKVYQALKAGDLEGARHAVSMIVGRDTQRLDEAGVVKAAVETVAENTSDGVTAPLLFLALGGLPLGMVYKAVNTMDSMVGYRNERYRWFGTAAARLDDVLNWIPARLSGLMMCLAAALLPGCSGRRALRVFFRDRRKHSSPNSAHTEAACAGALGVQLAGDAWYFGKKVSKPTIGDGLRPVERADVARACRLMYVTELLTLAAVLGWGTLLAA